MPAILHVPTAPQRTGVLLVVGGPQTRVGSHRQFVLLARDLATASIPVMRFDYRGMGDADGESRTFESVDDDIGAAIDVFVKQVPGLERVVLWGLCDAASAASFYAARDSRIAGLVLLNPWVRTEAGQARAFLTRYYLSRLVDPALWKKVFRGEFRPGQSIKELAGNVKKASGAGETKTKTDPEPMASMSSTCLPPLPERMLAGLQAFNGPILFILSGDDLTAEEFRNTAKSSRAWKKLLRQTRVQRHDLPDANHTFSRRVWRDQVAVWTRNWIQGLSER